MFILLHSWYVYSPIELLISYIVWISHAYHLWLRNLIDFTGLYVNRKWFLGVHHLQVTLATRSTLSNCLVIFLGRIAKIAPAGFALISILPIFLGDSWNLCRDSFAIWRMPQFRFCKIHTFRLKVGKQIIESTNLIHPMQIIYEEDYSPHVCVEFISNCSLDIQ